MQSSTVDLHLAASPTSPTAAEFCECVTQRLNKGLQRSEVDEEELIGLLERVELEEERIHKAVGELPRAHSTSDLEREVELERCILLAEERKRAMLTRAEKITSGHNEVDSSVLPAIVTLSGKTNH